MPKAWPDQEKPLLCLPQRSRTKLLNLLGQKSQVQIKEGRVRELAGLYTQEGWENVHVPSQPREGQRSRGHSVPPSQMARLGLQVLILA